MAISRLQFPMDAALFYHTIAGGLSHVCALTDEEFVAARKEYEQNTSRHKSLLWHIHYTMAEKGRLANDKWPMCLHGLEGWQETNENLLSHKTATGRYRFLLWNESAEISVRAPGEREIFRFVFDFEQQTLMMYELDKKAMVERPDRFELLYGIIKDWWPEELAWFPAVLEAYVAFKSHYEGVAQLLIDATERAPRYANIVVNHRTNRHEEEDTE